MANKIPEIGDTIGRLRITGLLEGCSFLLLLLVAMPLKYLLAIPEAVRWTGWCHGLLFMLYLLAAFSAWLAGRLPIRLAALTLVASFFPAGPFLIDRKLAALENGGNR